MKQSQSNLVTSILENIVHTIPEDLVLQILEKLPAKSLMRFKCVSKRWCSMIEDPEFVDAFRVRSHIRGTKLLQKISRNGREISGNDLFLVDSEDIVVPLPVFQENSHVLVTPVEGLVCCNNTVYNPTTGKAIDLPSCNLNSYAKRMSEDIGASAGCYDWNGRSDYLLGFDVSLKKYKVLSICQMSFDGKLRYTDNWDIHEKQVYAEVLTLGTNSWKNISINYSLARELCQGFYVCRSCSINGTIYILINLGCGMDLDILTFDTSHEKFQLLHLQQELGYNYYIGYNYDKFVGEIEGHFALIHDDLEKVWILDEVSEGGKWTLLDLLLPAWWCTSRRFQVRAIGSNQSGEILFQVDDNKFSEEVRRTTIFSYTIESKDVRRMTQLDHPRSTMYFILPNFVETIHPLKPEF